MPILNSAHAAEFYKIVFCREVFNNAVVALMGYSAVVYLIDPVVFEQCVFAVAHKLDSVSVANLSVAVAVKIRAADIAYFAVPHGYVLGV